MILNIRQGIFETNSSSVHTLSICKNKKNLSVPKKVYFSLDGEYGWGYDIYNDVDNKTDYFHQCLLEYATVAAFNEFKLDADFQNYKDSWCPECACTESPIYQKLLQKYTSELKQRVEAILAEYGCVEVKWADEEDVDNNCHYIDHIDQTHKFVEDLLNCPELLIYFLFNSNSEACIDSDNYHNGDYQVPGNPEDYYIYEKGN